MEKIKTILVPMDGSKNSFKALTKAIFLAKKCGASISALYVLRTAFDNP
ncbi:MAG: universal stress protein, partial [Nitrosopumilaceae archaeon]